MTGSRTARIIVGILFVALLATPVVIKRIAAARERTLSHTDAETALARHGFYLQEVSRAAGIDFVHEAPSLDPRLEPIMPEVASMGASVSIVDFDRDGWPDIYVVNSAIGSKNALYRNMHDGTFEDVAPELGVADVNQSGTGVSTGAVWGDYDNDGYEDLFLIKWGRPELFHNDQGRGFTRVSEKAGLPAWMNADTAIWFDYDGDGRLDLFVGGYYAEDIDLWHVKTTRIMPDSFEYAKNGGRKYLFHNLGNGKFEEVSAKAGIDSHRWALAASAADLRGTGHPDLFVSNDYGVSELYFNDGKRFHEVGKETGIGFAPKSGMNAAFGDILNQGKYAVYVSNISEDGVLIQGNNLWVPKQGTTADTLQYENLARDFGVELGGWSFGAQFGDLNNDGTLDLYLVNGYISLDHKRSYWYDFSKVAGGNSTIIGDAANWPAFQGRSLSGYQNKRVWLNDGEGDPTPPSTESPILAVRTKIDLKGSDAHGARPTKLAISAKSGAGIDRLLDAIAELAEERMSSREPALLTLERHRRGFQDAHQALALALSPEAAAEPELIAEDLRRAAFAMDRIVGKIGVEDVLGEIFARLCVGK